LGAKVLVQTLKKVWDFRPSQGPFRLDFDPSWGYATMLRPLDQAHNLGGEANATFASANVPGQAFSRCLACKPEVVTKAGCGVLGENSCKQVKP